MDLTVRHPYSIGPVTFRPSDTINERWAELGHIHRNVEAGTASLELQATDESAAAKRALNVLQDYHLLLSWGHERYVGFGPYECYAIRNGREGHEARVSFSQRTGNPDGSGLLFGFGDGVREFLEITHPQLTNSDFEGKMRIKDALSFHVESVAMSETIAEAKFVLSWTCLEILANAHAKATGQRRLFREGIRVVITRLLSDFELGPYDNYLRKFVRFRDDIVHGNPLSDYSGYERARLLLSLQRLVDKVLISVFGIADKPFIHPAYTRTDLLADS